MKTPPLAQILLNNHPELAGHLEQQAAEMRAPRRNSNPDRTDLARPAARHLATVAR